MVFIAARPLCLDLGLDPWSKGIKSVYLNTCSNGLYFPYRDDNERLVKPKDKRVERLIKRRAQFSARTSSTFSEGSFDAETGLLSGIFIFLGQL